jgi:ribosomal protein S18 acetylase RimI-like enzyme
MELDFTAFSARVTELPRHYSLVPWDESLLREHAEAKFARFHWEMDANVFPCLGRRDGCLRLMREISRRANFVPEATWLLRFTPEKGRPEAVGTVQGLEQDEWGAIQNLGVAREHRGLGLGTLLVHQALMGFRQIGLTKMHLEVTSDNTAAIRLYSRLGFLRAKTVFKAAEVAGV